MRNAAFSPPQIASKSCRSVSTLLLSDPILRIVIERNRRMGSAHLLLVGLLIRDEEGFDGKPYCPLPVVVSVDGISRLVGEQVDTIVNAVDGNGE